VSTMSKHFYLNLLFNGLINAILGRIFNTKILVSTHFFYFSVSKKCFPSRSLSLLKAEITTPTNKLVMKKAPKMIKVRKKKAKKGYSL
jgi:hypothetical protein